MPPHDALKKLLAGLFFCVFTATISGFGLAHPPQNTRRKIVSDDFTKNRVTRSDRTTKESQEQSSTEKQSKLPSNRTYRFASSQIDRPLSRAHQTSIAQLGVTIWRLRSMTSEDVGATILVEENGNVSKWVAERVEADTVFHKGDFVRLSIESPRAGYLYVINRDQFADGTTGDPMLIYPWGGMERAGNRVRPGRIIDIPAQEDVPSYFKATPTAANQIGELLTIIVTKTPLELPISEEPSTIPKAQLAQWQRLWKSDTERFEMEGGAGELWTKKEQQAAAGVRARKLTRTDPSPQTIYRVAAANNSGFLLNVRLAYTR